jgi:hypothetical protein
MSSIGFRDLCPLNEVLKSRHPHRREHPYHGHDGEQLDDRERAAQPAGVGPSARPRGETAI